MTQRECRGCDAPGGWKNQPEPQLVDRREQVLDSLTAYQITSMLEGVVQGGTATILREVGKPIAGKTGTTSDGKDVWFVGFSPDLVVGLYLGYDKPRSLGRAAQGGRIAAPIAKDFMKLALADKPATPFKIPAGIRLVRIDAKSGMRPARARAAAPFWKPSSRAPRRRRITCRHGRRRRRWTRAAGIPARRRQVQGICLIAGNIMRPGTGRLY